MERVTFEFIQPRQVGLAVDGVEVVISPITVDKLPQLTAQAQPLIDELLLAPPEVQAMLLSGTVDGEEQRANFAAWLADVVTRHGDRVMQVVAICAEQPVEWVRKLLPDRLIVLLLLSIEVNADFFAQMLPALKGLAGSLKLPRLQAASTGLTPSSS